MTYKITKGEIFDFKKRFLREHPHINNGNFPDYMLEEMDENIPDEGITLRDAFDFLMQNSIKRQTRVTKARYRCGFRRFFIWVAQQVGEEFQDSTDDDKTIIHYSLSRGVLSWN